MGLSHLPRNRPMATRPLCTGERTERSREGWQRRTLHVADEVIPVVENICEAMSTAGYSEQDLFAMRLALEEAIVNAVKHGNRDDSSKSVRIHYKVRPDCVLVRVEDQG